LRHRPALGALTDEIEEFHRLLTPRGVGVSLDSPPLLAVTDPAGAAWMPWNDSKHPLVGLFRGTSSRSWLGMTAWHGERVVT
jgi:hypothetical protein